MFNVLIFWRRLYAGFFNIFLWKLNYIHSHVSQILWINIPEIIFYLIYFHIILYLIHVWAHNFIICIPLFIIFIPFLLLIFILLFSHFLVSLYWSDWKALEVKMKEGSLTKKLYHSQYLPFLLLYLTDRPEQEY